MMRDRCSGDSGIHVKIEGNGVGSPRFGRRSMLNFTRLQVERLMSQSLFSAQGTNASDLKGFGDRANWRQNVSGMNETKGEAHPVQNGATEEDE